VAALISTTSPAFRATNYMRIRTDLDNDYPCTHTFLPAFLSQMEVPEKRELLKGNICIDFAGCVCR
jgi:hypothetical protein